MGNTQPLAQPARLPLQFIKLGLSCKNVKHLLFISMQQSIFYTTLQCASLLDSINAFGGATINHKINNSLCKCLKHVGKWVDYLNLCLLVFLYF